MPKKSRAYMLGKSGYFSGKKAPAQDAKILSMMGREHKTNIKLLKDWSKGWHEQHTKSTNKRIKKLGIFEQY